MSAGSESPVWFVTGCNDGLGPELALLGPSPRGARRHDRTQACGSRGSTTMQDEAILWPSRKRTKQ